MKIGRNCTPPQIRKIIDSEISEIDNRATNWLDANHSKILRNVKTIPNYYNKVISVNFKSKAGNIYRYSFTNFLYIRKQNTFNVQVSRFLFFHDIYKSKTGELREEYSYVSLLIDNPRNPRSLENELIIYSPHSIERFKQRLNIRENITPEELLDEYIMDDSILVCPKDTKLNIYKDYHPDLNRISIGIYGLFPSRQFEEYNIRIYDTFLTPDMLFEQQQKTFTDLIRKQLLYHVSTKIWAEYNIKHLYGIGYREFSKPLFIYIAHNMGEIPGDIDEDNIYEFLVDYEKIKKLLKDTDFKRNFPKFLIDNYL